MSKKTLKNLKIISIICVIVLLVEIIYVGYKVLYQSKESVYFEGVNEMIIGNDYLVTVGSNNNNDNHYEKAKISKYNKNKEKQFERLFSVGYNSSYFGIIEDDNNFLVVGSYEKTKEDHDDSIRRGLFTKYDITGNVLFRKEYKLLDNTKFTSITKINDGYLVTGQSIYKNTHIGDDKGGAILIRYDKDGNIIWSRSFGSSKSAIFNKAIIVNNYIYVVGVNADDVAIICKYDFDGNIIKSVEYKYTDSLGFRDLIYYDRFIYVVGASRKSRSDTDAIIVKYDLECNYNEQAVYDGTGLDRFNRIIKDNQNKLVVIGTIAKSRKVKQKSVDEYNYDGIIAKYNNNLKKISVITYGDDKDDYFTDIKLFNDNYLVCGYSSYEDSSYMSKFISYSSALKVLGVE